MNKYLIIFEKIKNNKLSNNCKIQLEKIEQFVEGRITPQELLDGADDNMKRIIYYTINKIINYEDNAEYLPQEVIDSMKFVIPVEYLTMDEVLNGTFGTFEEILMSQDIKYNNLSDKNTEERYERLLLLFEKLDLDIDGIVSKLENIKDILAGATLEMVAIRLDKSELREKINAAKEIVKQRRISAFKDYVNCGRPESFFLFNEMSNHDRLVFKKQLEHLEIGVDVQNEAEKEFYLNTIDKYIIKDSSDSQSFRLLKTGMVKPRPLGGRH